MWYYKRILDILTDSWYEVRVICYIVDLPVCHYTTCPWMVKCRLSNILNRMLPPKQIHTYTQTCKIQRFKHGLRILKISSQMVSDIYPEHYYLPAPLHPTSTTHPHPTPITSTHPHHPNTITPTPITAPPSPLPHPHHPTNPTPHTSRGSFWAPVPLVSNQWPGGCTFVTQRL